MTGREIPTYADPDPDPLPPRTTAPAGACDAHAHVFGPHSEYPTSPERGYNPPRAPLEDLQRLHGILGIERCVLTQPSAYGTDNRAMLDAVARGGEGWRAVVAVGSDVTDEELQRLHESGARGVRLNMVDPGGMPLGSFAEVEELARRIEPLGWHVEVLIHVDDYPDMSGTLGRLPVPVVSAHLGYMKTSQGVDHPGFRDYLALLRDGNFWVKLSGPYRISARTAQPYDDTIPFAHALVEAAPNRVLWGSDWPHVIFNPSHQMPNDGPLFDHIFDWAPDEEMRRRIFVDNPAELYGF